VTDDPIDVLSGSSLNTLLRCGKQWEYAYVQRIKEPPRLKMILGTAGHEAAEVDLRQKIESRQDLPLDDVKDAFSTAFDREAVEAVEEPTKGLTKPLMKDKGIRSVALWHEKVAPQVQPAMVEEPVNFIINGQPYTGTIDEVDEDDTIRDWKFTGKKPSSADSYILNMVGYAIGFRQKTGRVEKRLVLDHVVSTKEPQHVPIRSDGPVKDESIVAFANVVGDAQRMVAAGIFLPTGIKSGACSWCGYTKICPAYRSSPVARRDTED
jgi:hypothetical protein